MLKNQSINSTFDIKWYMIGKKLQSFNKSNCFKFYDLKIGPKTESKV